MPNLVVNSSVTVIRRGARVTPPIGKVFAFTDREAQYILSVHPTGLRKPINESDEPVEAEAEVEIDDDTTVETDDEGKAAHPAEGDDPGKQGKAKAKLGKAKDEDDDI